MRLLGDIVSAGAKMFPEKNCIMFEDKKITYQQFNERINRLANALLTLGVTKGDRVLIMQTDCLQSLEINYALAKIGAVFIPLNYRFRQDEIDYLANNSEAKFFFVGEKYAELVYTMRNKLSSVLHYVCIEGTHPDMLSYEQLLIEAGPGEPEVEVKEDDLVGIIYTSGTTGFPKGAMLTHRIYLERHKVLAAEWRIRKDDVFYTGLPIYSITGFFAPSTFLAMGAAVAIISQFEASVVAQTIEKEKVTVCLIVPTMLDFILGLPDLEHYNLSSLRQINYGGSHISVTLLRKAVDKIGCGFANIFGAGTEGGLQAMCQPEDLVRFLEAEQDEGVLNCIGKAAGFVELRVVDPEGRDVKPGEVGEIIARTEQNMVGYWKSPNATAKTLRNGWLYAGDLGTIDQQGYLYLLDRNKDMISRGGAHIYPAEVEKVLYLHPRILEATVIGVPDEVLGESVKAIVVVKSGETLTDEEVVTFTKDRLASFKCPTSVDFVEALPRNTLGKVLKKELRDRYWEAVGRKI